VRLATDETRIEHGSDQAADGSWSGTSGAPVNADVTRFGCQRRANSWAADALWFAQTMTSRPDLFLYYPCSIRVSSVAELYPAVFLHFVVVPAPVSSEEEGRK
jgi:hypothetical protein